MQPGCHSREEWEKAKEPVHHEEDMQPFQLTSSNNRRVILYFSREGVIICCFLHFQWENAPDK